MKKIIEKLLGDPQKKELKRIRKIVDRINEFALDYSLKLRDEDFPKKTAEFKERVANGESLDDILPEAFALVKVACKRLEGAQWDVRGNTYTWDMPVPYDVQLIGGIVLHEGKIAEMRTGEGKTLVSSFPSYLNALSDKGVFLVTVNDYLAQRDAEWIGGLHRFLGLTVGVNKSGMNHQEKRDAYDCDITYGTNNEFGFDYLRDNMARRAEDRVQGELNYALIDEVDSILIDEARTPLIISAPGEESTKKYEQYTRLVKQLEENVHYNIDEKQRVATLSEEGISKMEDLLHVDNIYTEKGFEEVHHIEQALRAHAVYKKDVDYVVRDDKILIVDEFTGRLMDGRRYGQGLHQAIEAKEQVVIQRESKTMASITFQNFFRMFNKLSGMTGTADTEEEEFITIYGLNVLVIPTHRPIARKDLSDAIYKNESGKYAAIARKTKELNAKGQPVLIGTISVEKSEKLSDALKKEGISHSVLNAKYHEKEAEIVANAGQKGSVTIATNMAGRGTDIKLGEGVKDLGGLYVIGSARHESRRIDNQLRGRSGRQGDPGVSQFYVSLEDDLMRIFGGDRIQGMMEKLGLPDDAPIENRMISRGLEGAQAKVEGRNFDIRKHLVQYDDVMNRHREIIYKRRNEILDSENLKNEAILLIEQQVEHIVLSHPDDAKEIHETLMALHRDPVTPLALEPLMEADHEGQIDLAKKYLEAEYAEREKALPDPKIMRRAERAVMLRVIDMHWMRHISELKDLRSAVALSGYGQRDPLIEYKNHAFQSFQDMLDQIDANIVRSLFHVKINVQAAPQQKAKPAPSMPGHISTSESQATPTIIKADSPSPSAKVGRNEPCPCGSGKKYKKCHGA